MDFIDLARKRYSVRKFENTPIPRQILLSILEAARFAPSAVNFQPWQFLIMDDPHKKSEVANTYGKQWIHSAPVIIVALGNHAVSWRRGDGKDHLDIDLAIAIDHLTLAAAELGLGTCWVCKFDAMKCSELLGCPSALEPVALVPIGYPQEHKPSKKHFERKPISEIVHWNKLPNSKT